VSIYIWKKKVENIEEKASEKDREKKTVEELVSRRL